MQKGWIKLHRSLKKWEWYDDHNATRLLIHLILTANYEDKKWKGIVVKAGSRVIGRSKFSKEVGLSVQQLRTSLTKLKNSQEVTIKTTNKFTVVSLVKWEQLQSIDSNYNQQMTQSLTNEQPTTNQQLTTTKEDKEIKERKEDDGKESDSDKNVLISIQRCKEKYLASEQIKIAVSENKANKLSYQEIDGRIETFTKHLIGSGEMVKSFPDFCSHFRAWHKKNKKAKTNGTKRQFL